MVMAVPAKPGQWKTVTLEDGSTIEVELVGDEFCHFWRDAKGNVYTKDAGVEVYRIADKAKLIATSDSLRQAANASRVQRAPMMKNTLGADHDPYTGTKKGLVILVQFADSSFQEGHDQELYDDILNCENYTSEEGFIGSVRDYFVEQSDSAFYIDFDVVGPVTAQHEYAYYGQNYQGVAGADSYVRSLLNEACKGVDSKVNFADYDWDGDGYVDMLFMLYSGLGEANGGDENTIWPHEGVLASSLRFDGTYINTYACSCELQKGGTIDGIGTFVHEFSHCLGLPDMYDTNYENYGMSYWSPMDLGSYLGSSFVPCAYTSYERMYCGWRQPIEITGDTTVTDMGPISESGSTYIIYNNADNDEYYLLENRQQTGWDSKLYGEGMLVLHVDFDAKVWNSNEVNVTTDAESGNDHQRCTIVPADNVFNESTVQQLQGDLYPYSSNNSITRNTTPANTLYNANSDGTYYLDKSITAITQSSDGTISFNVVDDATIASAKPEHAIFYEGFSLCTGLGGNDGVWSGTGVASASFAADNDGWTSAQKFGAFACARFGTNVQNGKAVTPSFDFDGETVITFMAAAWPGDGTTLTVTAMGDNATLSQTSFTLASSAWTEYSTTLTGSGSVTITFKSSSHRFYLDEVAAVPAEYSGISTVTIDGTARDAKIFSLDGIYMGNSTDNLPAGIYIQGGKKFIK